VKYLDNSLLIGWVQYALCLSQSEYAREMKRLKVEQPTPFLIEGKSATTHFFYPKDDGNKCVAVVCLKPEPDMDAIAIATLLVHEAVHIWQEERERWAKTARAARSRRTPFSESPQPSCGLTATPCLPEGIP
jgi:hypothetical protein